MTPSPALEAVNLHKSYHDGRRELRVLEGLDLAVQPGETVAILGRSGSGKSTLLQCLGLLDRPTSGEVRVGGEATSGLSERRRTALRGRSLGFMFQQYHLLPEFTALENVLLAGALGGGAGFGAAARARATELLDAMGLADRLTHRPPELSGGERQRVAAARALVNDPAVIFADEPTGSLDAETGPAVLDRFRRAVRERRVALILVTHDHDLAAHADRILRLERGRLVAS